MNRDPQLPAGSGDEDSWESLAENLFGIEFRKIPDPGEIISPEDLEELEDQAVVPEPTDEEIDSAIAKSDELLEEGVTAEIEGEIEASEIEEHDAVEPAEDTYWDALKDWTWDESEDRSESEDAPPQRGRGPRGRREERSGRGSKRDDRGPRRDDRESRRARPADPSVAASREVPTTSDLRAEYVDDADFGFGLLDEEQPSEPRREPSASWEGKKPRDEKKEPATRPSAESRPSRETSSKGSEWASRREPPKPAEIDDDDFGTDLGLETSDESAEEIAEESASTSSEAESDRPRRRRRRGRRRSERREPERPAEPATVEEEEFEGIEVEIDSEELAETDDAAEDEAGRDERGPRRRRRGRRRGRGRDRDRATSGETSRAQEPRHREEHKEDAEPVAESWDEESDGSESEEDVVPSYANVPTWEQAIEYLLHPGQAPKSRDTESDSASSGEKSPRDSRRPRRGRGRRRR